MVKNTPVLRPMRITHSPTPHPSPNSHNARGHLNVFFYHSQFIGTFAFWNRHGTRDTHRHTALPANACETAREGRLSRRHPTRRSGPQRTSPLATSHPPIAGPARWRPVRRRPTPLSHPPATPVAATHTRTRSAPRPPAPPPAGNPAHRRPRWALACAAAPQPVARQCRLVRVAHGAGRGAVGWAGGAWHASAAGGASGGGAPGVPRWLKADHLRTRGKG
jgi:hypothetical protein